MACFYIFRHGQTFATKANSGYGVKIFNAAILDEGKPVIKKMGQFLKDVPTDLNVTSPFLRCRQTVKIISQVSGKKFVTDKRLGEFFLEPFGHFKRRINNFLKEVEKKGYKNVAICTHQAVIVRLLRVLTGAEYENLNMYNYPYPGVLIIVDKSIKEIDFNDQIVSA